MGLSSSVAASAAQATAAIIAKATSSGRSNKQPAPRGGARQGRGRRAATRGARGLHGGAQQSHAAAPCKSKRR